MRKPLRKNAGGYALNLKCFHFLTWSFLKVRGRIFFGVPILRSVLVVSGLYLGLLSMETLKWVSHRVQASGLKSSHGS